MSGVCRVGHLRLIRRLLQVDPIPVDALEPWVRLDRGRAIVEDRSRSGGRRRREEGRAAPLGEHERVGARGLERGGGAADPVLRLAEERGDKIDGWTGR